MVILFVPCPEQILELDPPNSQVRPDVFNYVNRLNAAFGPCAGELT